MVDRKGLKLAAKMVDWMVVNWAQWRVEKMVVTMVEK
jgi:hypothetical protein